MIYMQYEVALKVLPQGLHQYALIPHKISLKVPGNGRGKIKTTMKSIPPWETKKGTKMFSCSMKLLVLRNSRLFHFVLEKFAALFS